MGGSSSKERSPSDQMIELHVFQSDTRESRIKSMSQSILKLDQLDDYSYETCSQLNSGSRSSAKGKHRAGCLKGMVSTNKIRYRDQYFDLDLTYITKRVITMGYPSSGCESLYRNSASDVVNFFRRYHNGHAKIYNLCAERDHIYNPALFTDHGLDFGHFPFLDHYPCKFEMIVHFCTDAFLYMSKHPDNVIAIHCKAGKGRTGLMTCCYLLFVGACKSFDEIVKFYGSRRTVNHEGLTISSQIRYLSYFEQTLRKHKIDPYPKVAIDIIENGAEGSDKYTPYTTKALKFINIGPFTHNATIKLKILDLDKQLFATYNVSGLLETRIEKISETSITHDQNGTTYEIVICLAYFKSEKVLPDPVLKLKDDLKFLIYINDQVLSVCFHLGFLYTLDNPQKSLIGYDKIGNPVGQNARKYDYEKWGKFPGFSYEEFKGHHFEKWYKKKKIQSTVHDDFSVIVGFIDY